MKDKIITWLDADLTHYGVFNHLQNLYDCDLYAIIDITDKPKKFFQEQKFVNFKKTWFYHDYIKKPREKPNLDYLANFEKKYNINLWRIAYNERIFYLYNEYYNFTSDEVLKILEYECRLFESILDEIKPDFLIMKAPDLHQIQLLYEICKAKNIRILLLGQTRFGYRSIISSLWHDIDKKYETDTQGPDRSAEELKDFLKGTSAFKWTADYLNKFRRSKWSKIKAVYKFLTSNNSNEKTHYTYYGRTKLKVLFKSANFLLKKKYRQIFIDNNLETTINENEKFIYFPMHLDQESSLLIGAPFYTNTIEMITNIVKSLPADYMLYVKEHPAQSVRAWRKISFYKQIMKLPQVRILHPSVEPDSIMNKCSLVISISSTASLEAAFYNKPSINFAYTPFEVLPSVHRIKNIEELFNTIRTSLKKEYNLRDVNNYVNFVNANSFIYNPLEIELGYSKYFYYDSNLVDVDIKTSQMKMFLEEFHEGFEILAQEYIKKIKQYKENN